MFPASAPAEELLAWQPDGIWLVVYNGDRWITSPGEDRYRRAIYTTWRRSNEIIEEARAAAKQVAEREGQRAVAQANEIVQKAREAGEAEQKRLMAELRKDLSRLIVETTAKVTGKVLTAAAMTYVRANFGNTSAAVTEAQAKEYLDKNPSHRLLLEGHCDWRGTAEYNLGLGDRRAGAVRKYLQSLGVPAERLETLSKGSLEAAKNADDATMSKDRRVDLVVAEQYDGADQLRHQRRAVPDLVAVHERVRRGAIAHAHDVAEPELMELEHLAELLAVRLAEPGRLLNRGHELIGAAIGGWRQKCERGVALLLHTRIGVAHDQRLTERAIGERGQHARRGLGHVRVLHEYVAHHGLVERCEPHLLAARTNGDRHAREP